MYWEKTSEKPLVDWNENHTKWTQSNHCPTGLFLVGSYHNGNFCWYKVKLSEKGLVEIGDEEEFPFCNYGLGFDDFEYWMHIEPPIKLSGYAEWEKF